MESQRYYPFSLWFNFSSFKSKIAKKEYKYLLEKRLGGCTSGEKGAPNNRSWLCNSLRFPPHRAHVKGWRLAPAVHSARIQGLPQLVAIKAQPQIKSKACWDFKIARSPGAQPKDSSALCTGVRACAYCQDKPHGASQAAVRGQREAISNAWCVPASGSSPGTFLLLPSSLSEMATGTWLSADTRGASSWGSRSDLQALKFIISALPLDRK